MENSNERNLLRPEFMDKHHDFIAKSAEYMKLEPERELERISKAKRAAAAGELYLANSKENERAMKNRLAIREQLQSKKAARRASHRTMNAMKKTVEIADGTSNFPLLMDATSKSAGSSSQSGSDDVTGLQLVHGAGTALPLRVDRGPPIGLRNFRRSSCYLNSVLQCLTFTSPLAEYCLLRLHSSTCTYRAARACTFCILEKRIRRSLVLTAPTDAPTKLYNQMTKYSNYFEPGRHEDAHELLRFLIDDCGKAFEAEHEQSEMGSQRTVLDELFGGVLQSHIQCRQCHAESTKREDMFDLNLEICKFSSLVQAFACFFRPEVLDGDNKYHCYSCKRLSVAQKQMSIHRAPKVLTIQLKIFDPLSGRKLNRHLQFETQLSISDYMSKELTDSQDPQYTLYGVIVHHGSSLNHGHYVAYVKDANEKWYLCNDENVSEESEKQVLAAKAYLLFYIRTDPTL